jgi:hypothetical protein
VASNDNEQPPESDHDHDEYGFDRNDQGQIDWMNKEASKFTGQVDKSLGQENETERAMAGQLMLVATVAFTGNVVLLGNGNVVTTLSNAQKGLVSFAVVLLLASMYSGIRYYRVLIAFHKMWVNANQEVAGWFAKWEFDNPAHISLKVDSRLQSLEIEPKIDWFNRQQLALWIAMGLYVVLLIALLFDFRAITNHLPTIIR